MTISCRIRGSQNARDKPNDGSRKRWEKWANGQSSSTSHSLLMVRMQESIKSRWKAGCKAQYIIRKTTAAEPLTWHVGMSTGQPIYKLVGGILPETNMVQWKISPNLQMASPWKSNISMSWLLPADVMRVCVCACHVCVWYLFNLCIYIYIDLCNLNQNLYMISWNVGKLLWDKASHGLKNT